MYHKRRKATHKRKTSRRRRVSGLNMDVTGMAIIIVGAIGSRIIANKLAASTNATMLKLAPWVGVAAGIILPMVSKNPMLKQLSLGLVAGGSLTALGPTGLKVISGMEATISGRMGYPYNAGIPFRKVAGIEYTSKANFSGGNNSSASVISGINQALMSAGSGMAGSGAYGNMMGY